jgi:transposase
MDDRTFDRQVGEVRRFEVITGAGRRRRWTSEAKGRIVAESFAPGARVTEVARRHDLRPQQLFDWRRVAREGRLVLPGDDPAFVPVVAMPGGPTVPDPDSAPAPAGVIEITLRGITMTVRGRVEAGTLAEVLAAVKAVR